MFNTIKKIPYKERLARSWDITKKTFAVIKADKEILAFPILSVIFTIGLFLLLLFPFIITLLVQQVIPPITVMAFFGLLFFFLEIFMGVFSHAAIVHIAKTRFEGGDATFMEGVKAALNRKGQLIKWALLTGTVGIIINAAESKAREKSGVVGSIAKMLIGLAGLAWKIVSIFVVPSIMIKGTGPIDSLKSSYNTIKKTWGESLVKYLGLNVVERLVGVIGFIIFVIPAILFFLDGVFSVGVGFIILWILYITLTKVILSAADTVFDTALFMYADTGKVPNSYTKEDLDHAFRVEKK
ncbi:hypothetical protein HQ489_05785 [Candidatus Woesearchaeota archaeon]|nr:hypothetical protein [Candidatus Woesearchaeota archaeon]